MKRPLLRIIPFLAFGAGAVALMLAFGAAAADPILLEARPPDPPAQEAEAVPGELIVRFNSSTPRFARVTAIAQSGSKLARDLPLPGYSLVQVPLDREQEFADRLRDTPGVRSVEPNFLRHALFDPNDEYYSFQWHFQKIGLPAAWDSVTGSGVTVAVIDTGVAYEDCAAAVCGAEFFQAPDFQGTSFVAPYDFVDGDTHANDEHGHGTHVAGTIAQATNNAVGVAGIAFNASIMPVRVLDANGSGSTANVIDGIMWAANNGADVINLSLGSPDSGTAEEAAVDYAVAQGVVVVAAAGNSNSSSLLCPACYPNSIAVGATRFDDTRAYYSSYGTGLGGHTLDLVAPGGDVTVDQNADGYSDGVLQQTYRHFCTLDPTSYSVFAYCFAQGTSMASPHVAGVAALVLSANPALTPQDVRDVLTATALDVGPPGYDLQYGHGRLDAAAAVSEALTPGATPMPSPTPTSIPTATATPTPTAPPPLPDTPTATATTPATPSATATSTPTGSPPPIDTPTPTAGPSVDSDLDGCTDEQELGSAPSLGGQRDPANPWDFFDTPDDRNIRDKSIASEDIFRVLARFGEEGDPLIDPFSAPPETGYHPAFDRGPLVGPNPWNLGPADGSVASLEVFAIIAQFGHSCA